ncbi:hypothetical protein ACFQU7_25355 [Pseudoroseomonas wenyumeiae]
MQFSKIKTEAPLQFKQLSEDLKNRQPLFCFYFRSTSTQLPAANCSAAGGRKYLPQTPGSTPDHKKIRQHHQPNATFRKMFQSLPQPSSPAGQKIIVLVTLCRQAQLSTEEPEQAEA